MLDVMIDIETLSTNPNSLILTIGAIKFSRNKDIKCLKDLDTFYVRINQNSCEKLNMDINKDTLDWWNLQSEESKYEAFMYYDVQARFEIVSRENTWKDESDLPEYIMNNKEELVKKGLMLP